MIQKTYILLFYYLLILIFHFFPVRYRNLSAANTTAITATPTLYGARYTTSTRVYKG